MAPALAKTIAWAAIMMVAACAPRERVEAEPVGAFRNAGTTHELNLKELAWLHPSADAFGFLTSTPRECLQAAEDREKQYLVDVGRAAFNSPLLFGGPAARGGLSCASCHRGGRDNPAFFLAGLSGEAGTADVTSALFSKTREDGVFNPVLIPSLVGIAGKEAFGTQAPAPSLHDFIENAVIDEFQGAPPPPAIVEGLAAYVAHLDDAACDSEPVEKTVAADMKEARRAIKLTGEAIERDDRRAADFLILSAQNALGRAHERFAAPDLEDQRRALEASSRDLASIRALINESSQEALAQLAAAGAQTEMVAADLHNHRRQSLYDVETLRAALRAAGRDGDE